MKLLTKNLLKEYGFIAKDSDTIMTKDKFNVVIKNGGNFYYSNMGFDYPLPDIASLRKLYKEVKGEELKPI